MTPNKKPIVNDQDWAQALEIGVEAYTDMLLEAVFEGTEDEIGETLSGDPFCGCNTCFWRETLYYLVPRIIEGYEQGKVTVEE